MRLLCIDHFFEQDIEALRLQRGSHECWSVGYKPFLNAAREVFPEEVWSGIDAFFRPEHAAARELYAKRVASMLDRLYLAYRFDCVCAPSDTFFWIRAVIERCQALGIPFTVLQKEATIPPGWLEGPAREWGRISPFIADHMMVSSEHHARFWVNAATAPEIIEVTGQPRFDVYARPERWRSLAAQGVDVPAGRPTVLFLTYDVNAYLPIIDRTGMAPWQQLRDETERVLLELAAAGEVNVLIKGHPQPAEDQTAHLTELGRAPGVTIVDPQADVRYIITAVDTVLGFQTTALLESLAAGRPTIYTWWSEAADRYADDLIPFHAERDALDVVRSPGALRDAIRVAVTHGEAPERLVAGRALVTQYIGPVDGRAADRCWEAMAARAAGAQLTPAGREREQRARRRRPVTKAAAIAAGAVWSAAHRALPVAYPAYRAAVTHVRGNGRALSHEQVVREVRRRRRAARERHAAALRDGPG